MACQGYDILIQKAIDRQLSMDGCRELAAHINSCPECAALYYEYKALDEELKQTMAAVEVPADLKAGVMAALPKKTVRSGGFRLRRVVSMVGMAAAAAALVVAAGVSGLFSPDSDDPVAPVGQLPVADTNIVDPDENDPIAADNNEVIDNTQVLDPNDQGTDQPGDITDPEAKEPVIHYSGGVMLPDVAQGSDSHGSYSLYTLAAHSEHDALVPSVNGNIVSYYIIADGCYLRWEAPLDKSSEPVYAGEEEGLPAVSAVAGFVDSSSEYGYVYVYDISADGILSIINCGGDAPGLYLMDYSIGGEPVLVDAMGGGSIACWAPDGNKALYTGADGSLHLFYPDQDLILDLYEGAVSAVCWAADSRNIVFSALDSSTGYMSIFSVIVP